MNSAASVPALIDRIYEAAVATELWPGVLEDVGTSVGAKGAVFIALSTTGTDWVCAPSLEDHMADYAAAGWAADLEQTAPLFADTHAGFRAETAYRSVAEIEALPVKRDFMIPRGLIAAAASVFQGASNDALYLTIEGFSSHALAERAVPSLDALRPHVGRALSLSSKVRQAKTDALVKGLDVVGVGAAVVGSNRRLRASNTSFEQALGNLMFERSGLVAFANGFLHTAVQASLAQADQRHAGVRSVCVRSGDDVWPIVVHLVPLKGRARDVCGSDGVLMLIANVANVALPNADLLRLLFDLTPAEARVARLLSGGLPIDQIALVSGTSRMTVRSQLRNIFSKTGVSRQAELVRLVCSMRNRPNPKSSSRYDVDLDKSRHHPRDRDRTLLARPAPTRAIECLLSTRCRH